ncbi:response regulator [bacterium]|nr:response regulator [bacterium]
MAKNSNTKNLKVLLIEDDSYVLQLYQDIITSETNWQLEVIDSLTDLKKDFEKIKKINPDVIILDLILPAFPESKKGGGYILDKELGFQILERLKKDEATKKIPVIVISALSGEADKDRAKALGAEKYLVKSEILPFQIIEAINEVLGL